MNALSDDVGELVDPDVELVLLRLCDRDAFEVTDGLIRAGRKDRQDEDDG